MEVIVKNLPEYPGVSVNTLGQVFKNSEPVTLRYQKSGYVLVGLRNVKDYYRQESVHRLVAGAFLVMRKGHCIDHINGIKHDNRLENLEVVTYRENTRRRYALQGLPKRLVKL